MITRKTFLFFLLDTPTGRAYYKDNSGTVLTAPITSTQDISLKNAPGNWLDIELSFIRNTTYKGINRAYSTSLDFVGDGADIIRQLFLLNAGTEVPLTLLVFKYNSQPIAGQANYRLYFKAPLDLKKINCTVLEKVTVNLLEGGAAQLLKSYENTVIQIPCDGSIPENFKVNYDGLKVDDTFFYQISSIEAFSPANHWILASFINNEGDNYGIVRGTPSFGEVPDADEILESTEYLLYSTRPITIKIKGSITVGNKKLNIDDGNPIRVRFSLSYYTTSSGFVYLIPDTRVLQTTTFNYNVTINLKANEKVFISLEMNEQRPFPVLPNGNQIIGGNFSIQFSSQSQPTRAWAISYLDAFKYILKQICILSSTTSQTFNYEAVSALLSQYQNYALNSGDALRASGDPNYQRYYSIDDNLNTSFGPVIKTTLKELYQDIDTILNCSLGPTPDGNGLFIERLRDVYNSDTVDFSVGEVASLEWLFSDDKAFSDISIGYKPETYDQKAGKYEYNTTLEMKAPINTFSKKLDLISKTRTDTYGIERLRTDQGGTSTTRNDSDNSRFLTDINRSQSVFDFFDAKFVSIVEDPNNTSNTNIHYTNGEYNQKISLPITEGEYFQPLTDKSIFVLSYIDFGTIPCNLTIDGIVNAVNAPAGSSDSITIELIHNGVVVYSVTIPVTGVNTPISVNHNFTQTLLFDDCVYIRTSTTANAEANINTVSLVLSTFVTISGANIPVLPGTFQQLLSMPNIVPEADPFTPGTSNLQCGYQYFVFNSLVPNTGFLLNLNVEGFTEGENADLIYKIFINGVIQPDMLTVHGSVPRTSFAQSLFLPVRNYQLGDIIFISVNATGNSLFAQNTAAYLFLTSNYIQAFALNRPAYTSISGVPLNVVDITGAGAPYNVELSPKSNYLRWKDYIKSCFMDVVTGNMTNAVLSKNQYLQRSIGGVTIIERSDESILNATRLFYPIPLKMKTNIPINFADLMSASINTHIHATFMGNDFYFFAEKISQKPALNESQEWEVLLSPKTDLSIFANINQFKQPDMGPNSIRVSPSSPVQFVPFNRALPAKYHTYNRNQFLFAEQLNKWFEQSGYCQPWQIGDPINLQFITNELDPIYYRVFAKDGTLAYGPTDLNTIASPAISNPYILWQKIIDTTGWDAGCYYIVISSPTAGDLLISECQDVEIDQPETVLVEGFSTSNTQGLVFDGNTVYRPSFRVEGGFDNNFKQKYVSKVYIDQPQDIQMLNAIPFEVTTLYLKGWGGVPDYMAKKTLRYLLMNSSMLEGEGFTLNEGSEMDITFTKGAPKKLYKIEIRPTKNDEGLDVVAGVVDTDNSVIVSVTNSFGPNINNAAGTADNDIIEITVSD